MCMCSEAIDKVTNEVNASEPGLIPGRVAPGFSQVGIMPDDAAGWRVGILGDLPFPPHLNSGAAPFSPHSTLIGPQNLVVNSQGKLIELRAITAGIFRLTGQLTIPEPVSVTLPCDFVHPASTLRSCTQSVLHHLRGSCPPPLLTVQLSAGVVPHRSLQLARPFSERLQPTRVCSAANHCHLDCDSNICHRRELPCGGCRMICGRKGEATELLPISPEAIALRWRQIFHNPSSYYREANRRRLPLRPVPTSPTRISSSHFAFAHRWHGWKLAIIRDNALAYVEMRVRAGDRLTALKVFPVGGRLPRRKTCCEALPVREWRGDRE
ncbi:hypothetical protein PR048_025448 [Dryococelus australis]|uniref:FHA domain-containing protein n=1 Tax=Dryococelus australis TaxID=614101 RepID=A0ABQ9GRF4_9NEOP|nr:hypothetical protein PR048_025448 [Dryococelus australis]